VVWGSKNVGWLGVTRDSSNLQLWLGVGAALVLTGFAMAGWGARLRRAGPLGTAALLTLIAGAALNVVSALIEFAIFGTLGLGLGLVLLAVVVFQERLMPQPDRWLVAVSAVLSLTWNTETSTAWFLAASGALWVALSIRLLPVTARPGAEASI
jgi:hypothetical protein